MNKKQKNLIAHAKKISAKSFANPHLLKQHLEKTSILAGTFADKFGLSKIAQTLGLVHDMGKASRAFQERIRLKSEYDVEAHLEGKTPQHVDHSTAGAQFLVQEYGEQLGTILAYIAAGHHAGLPDGRGEQNAVLSYRLKKQVEPYHDILPWIKERLPQIQPNDLIPAKSKTGRLDPYKIHFLIRMLFSALTDADFLDTEAYMEPEKARQRGSKYEVNQLWFTLDNFLHELSRRDQTPINKERNAILKHCLKAAEKTPGIFSLTVPTGGGKTIASLAFALKHAVKHSLRRVIYVIPYTSIIIQNAGVFRDIFSAIGEDVVLEHHSNVDPDVQKETPFNRLAAENWDAPLIVTTNVQFFESFYSNRSSSCRKLHNVADSVIIFDEAQMLPPEMLRPALSVIRELTDNYGCTAILCTATQPVLTRSSFLRDGLENVTEIIPDPEALYRRFKRVKVEILDDKQNNKTLAERLSAEKQVLAIVNTRKEAREIWQQTVQTTNPKECFHLSTMMCPQHRADTLLAIRERLRGNQPCRVISTQLIEAGVDVDFPVVYRAAAGIDSIAQAAGRCNREGKLAEGKVFIFEGENPPPPGHLRHSAESGFYIMKAFPNDPLCLQAVENYFNDFYSKQYSAHRMDKKGIMDSCNSRPDAIPFAQISRNFALITDRTIPLLVPYENEGERSIEELRNCYDGLVPRPLRRILQRYLVNLREYVFAELYKAGVIEDIFKDGQYFVLLNKDIYDPAVGLNTEKPEFIKSESLII